MTLLEEAVAKGVSSFVFTSTTSVFGVVLARRDRMPALWVTEKMAPHIRNIYGVTKLAAENLCELFASKALLPVIILRISRFFPEADDNPEIRSNYQIENVQANEFLHRRIDIDDVVAAHLLAIEKAPALGCRRYIISATTPFGPEDLASLSEDAPSVVHRLFPDCAELYRTRGWKLFPSIDRVYVNHLAVAELGWQPKYDFRHILESVRKGVDFRSPLSRQVGSKGYHASLCEDGPYPVAP